MPLTNYKLTKLLNMASSLSVAKLSKQFGLKYSETRRILKEHGVKLRRGRKRGSGKGLEFLADGHGRFDRRVSWIKKQIEAGRCTSCGKKNDSDSLYHCKECLKKRNDAKANKKK